MCEKCVIEQMQSCIDCDSVTGLNRNVLENWQKCCRCVQHSENKFASTEHSTNVSVFSVERI